VSFTPRSIGTVNAMRGCRMFLHFTRRRRDPNITCFACQGQVNYSPFPIIPRLIKTSPPRFVAGGQGQRLLATASSASFFLLLSARCLATNCRERVVHLDVAHDTPSTSQISLYRSLNGVTVHCLPLLLLSIYCLERTDVPFPSYSIKNTDGCYDGHFQA
jgi:hypothetical protein